MGSQVIVGQQDRRGRFLAGHRLQSPSKHPKLPKPPILTCPDALLGIQAVWVKLARLARKGDIQAGLKLIELAGKYGGTAEPVKPKHLESYVGIPPVVGQVLYSLDCTLEQLVRRVQAGLPCSDVEQLIANVVLSLNGSATPLAPKSKLASLVVDVVSDAREKGMLPEGEAETWKVRQGSGGENDSG